MHCGLRVSGTDLAPRASGVARVSPSSSNPFNNPARGSSVRAANEEIMKRLVRAFAIVPVVAFAAACASAGGGSGGTVTAGPSPDQTARPGVIWPIKTREHVDLWLHGYALLQEDTTFVPFFKRGYGTEMTVLKNRANVVTQLDANRDKLRARLTTNPQLINAQFVPLNFSTWNELAQTVDL